MRQAKYPVLLILALAGLLGSLALQSTNILPALCGGQGLLGPHLVCEAEAAKLRARAEESSPDSKREAGMQLGPAPGDSYGKLPLSFEANHGQTDKRVKFLSRGNGYTLFLAPTEAVLRLKRGAGTGQEVDSKLQAPDVLRMKLVGANSGSTGAGLEQLPGRSNYFIGNDPKNWRTDIPTFAKIRFEEVYPGVDLIYYGNQRELEFDFVVAVGADPKAISLGYDGADQLEIDPLGDLIMTVADHKIRQRKPLIYQQVEGGRKVVPGHYSLSGEGRVGFEVAAYDETSPLIIDPVLSYSTHLGGSNQDRGQSIAVDGDGNAYVVGFTDSASFPTTVDAFQTAFESGRPGCVLGDSEVTCADVFIAKLNPAGSAFVYSTYLGGTGRDVAFGLDLDGDGNAYVAGQTSSDDFPTTSGSFDTSYNDDPNGSTEDVFVTKLDSTGTALAYSTYLGGSSIDAIGALVVKDGKAYVTGATGSSNFPTTAGAFQTTFMGGTPNPLDAFVAKLNSTGTALVYSTYLGDTGRDSAAGIAVDADGEAVVVVTTRGAATFPTTAGAYDTTFNGSGEIAVTKVSADGSALVFSTFLGGTGFDGGRDVALDKVGNPYVTGETSSVDFPTSAGAFQTSFNGGVEDAFVTKLNAEGSALVYSTYLGGSGRDTGQGIAVNAKGNAWVSGFTDSLDFPMIGALQSTLAGGSDVLVTKLKADGSGLLFSTFYGGSGDDLGRNIVADALDSAYVVGTTASTDYPTVQAVQTAYGGGLSDSFIMKIAVPRFNCLGFDPPMDAGPVTVKKNRVLPLKAELLSESGEAITDLDLPAPPVIQIIYDSGLGESIDVTQLALPAGQGTEGNEFEFDGTKFRYNLSTKDFTAEGTYTITMVSGDLEAYTIDSCTAVFVTLP